MNGVKAKMFTNAELWLMEILWRNGSTTVRDAQRELPARSEIPSRSIEPSLRRLERLGFICSEKNGRRAIYRPA